MIKNFQQNKNRREFPQPNNGIYENPTTNYICNDE